MVKAFRPSLEPPAHRQVRLTQAARPGLCLLVCAGVTVLLLGAFAASGWNIYVNRFDKNRFRFSSGDEVAVSDITSDFSSVFCDSYEVELWARGQVYLLPSRAEVNTSLVGQEEFFSMLQVAGLVYSETRLYLLDQSKLSFSACRQNGSLEVPAEVVLIKGKSNLMSWRKNKKCGDCVLRRVEIPLGAYCTSDVEEQEEPDGEAEGMSSANEGNFPSSKDPNAETIGLDKKNENGARSMSGFLKYRASKHSETNPSAVTTENVSIPEIWKHSSLDSSESDATGFKHYTRTRQVVLFNHTVTGNDKYFLIIFYGRPSGPESLFTQPGIQLQGKVKRTSFDVEGARQVCNLTGVYSETENRRVENFSSDSANSCQFGLPWGSDMDVVVHFGDPLKGYHRWDIYEDDPRLGTDYASSVTLADPNHGQEGMITQCHVRLSIWICLFVMLPVVLAAILSTVIGCFLCRGRPAQQFTAKWHRHRHGRKKRNLGSETRVKDSDVLVDAEVLPEGDQSSMAIQGD